MTAYLSIFLSGLIAATLLPAFSEVALSALVIEGYDPLGLWVAASAGNTLGACLNWILGRYLRSFDDRRWFPLKGAQIIKADHIFQRFGVWTLFFAWLPIIGDPLTFVAGTLRTNFCLFLILVATGKALRYAAIIALATPFGS